MILRVVKKRSIIESQAWVMKIAKEPNHMEVLLALREEVKGDWYHQYSKKVMKSLTRSSEVDILNKMLRAGAHKKSSQIQQEKIAAKWLCKVSKNLVLLMKVVRQKAREATE